MTRLTDERIASLARQYLGTCKRVFYTKWKDGIDIEYPTLEVEQFARAIEAELSKQEPVAWQERPWVALAYARLGAVRDRMDPHNVEAVQEFLGPLDASKG